MKLRTELVTGNHCITENIKLGFDTAMQHESAYCTFGNNYHNFYLYNGKFETTYDEEFYILYDGIIPVGIFNPCFDRANNLVRGILPLIFMEHRGKGYCKNIFAWCINRYFKRGFSKIHLNVYESNKASLHSCSKFFILEGILRKQVFMCGEYCDRYVYGLLKSEYDGSDPSINTMEPGRLFDIRANVTTALANFSKEGL